jgi:hypothetical protein
MPLTAVIAKKFVAIVRRRKAGPALDVCVGVAAAIEELACMVSMSHPEPGQDNGRRGQTQL